ncbi:hypothetical protein PR048_030863 [Dryococelus australis]|uniref:Uncharacterized protein n=1 Tax=Dryococelus australis TaxID=614101 RepID=A0ABQ9GA28_9NEOP|nr:hypothetical protein PR048_030863 [Dryococelus australis]
MLQVQQAEGKSAAVVSRRLSRVSAPFISSNTLLVADVHRHNFLSILRLTHGNRAGGFPPGSPVSPPPFNSGAAPYPPRFTPHRLSRPRCWEQAEYLRSLTDLVIATTRWVYVTLVLGIWSVTHASSQEFRKRTHALPLTHHVRRRLPSPSSSWSFPESLQANAWRGLWRGLTRGKASGKESEVASHPSPPASRTHGRRWVYTVTLTEPCLTCRGKESVSTVAHAFSTPRLQAACSLHRHCSTQLSLRHPQRFLFRFRLDSSNQSEPDSITGQITPGLSQVGIVPDNAADRRGFFLGGGISRFTRPFIPDLLHSHLSSPSSALMTSVLRAAQISPLTDLHITVVALVCLCLLATVAMAQDSDFFTNFLSGGSSRENRATQRDMIDCKYFYMVKDILLRQCELGSTLVDDRPVMNAVKYRVLSSVVWTNRTMVSSNTDTNRTGVLAVVDIEWSSVGMQGQGKREIPAEKTRRPAASADTIPTFENLGVARPGFEPVSPSQADNIWAAVNNEFLRADDGEMRNARMSETGDPRENLPTSCIVRHDSHLRKSGVTRPGVEPGSSCWEARPVLFPQSPLPSETSGVIPGASGYGFVPPGSNRIGECTRHLFLHTNSACHVATLDASGRRVLQSYASLRVHLKSASHKIDNQHVYTEVTFAIGSQFIRYALDDPEPIPYLQGSK